MGRFLYILFLGLCFSSCEKDIEIEISEPKNEIFQIYTKDFQEQRWQADFDLVLLDSKRNYPDFLREMYRLSCENIRAGIRFSLRDTIYNLTGFAECPNDGIISCRFNRNIFLIRNDSLKNIGYNNGGKFHISELKKEIQKIVVSPYRFHYEKQILQPALIHFYIEDDQPTSLIKEVLREVVLQFEGINAEMGKGFFKYTILFEGFSIMDIPPPPPPVCGTQ